MTTSIALEKIPVSIEDEMRRSYLDYAMSVIIGRALPDIRDGLKPVHRRILYAMFREGMLPDKKYSKCAGVVGEVLKKYHPHGDAAVYESLVRMAQDFNIRYPLIDGQGNFGCFTGETRVRLADGSTISFKELVDDYTQGKKYFVYSINNGRVEMALLRAPRLTKKNVPVVRVTVDNGEKIVCTPDHRFMLRDGSYREAQYLRPKDSLMPFYSHMYEGSDLNLFGYEQIYQPASNTWEFSHHLADEYNIKHKIYPRSAGRVRHHQDLNKLSIEAAREAALTHTDTLNHRVVSVEPAGHADVYDLTVNGLHNFALAAGVFVHNSIDGDPPAAYRYTEARLTKIAEEMLADIDKNTVAFVPNFDGSTEEPTLLPTPVPNLLINGSSGIAVGMATNIPPHNLREVADALLLLVRNPEARLEDIMKVLPGPDFPTAGFICGKDAIREAYKDGKGILQLRARANVETLKGGKESIVITEIPYQVNKARLIEKISELVQEKKIEGISDIRDESDREGMRIAVELKRDENASIILNQLYKHTPLQESFGAIMLCLLNNQPRLLGLKEILTNFLNFRREVVVRRTAFDLKKAEEKAHILEGLTIALEHLDRVIALIRRSRSPEDAKKGLISRYKLSEIQAQAILDTKLQRLTSLEREKIIEEHKETLSLIKRLKVILASDEEVMKIVASEISQIKEKYGDKRRTEIIGPVQEIQVEDLIAEEDMVVTISHEGYIKRNPVSLYRAQKRGGRGKMGLGTREEDFAESLFIASTLSYLLFFTDLGRVYWLKVHEIPQAGRAAKGKPIVNLLKFEEGEKITAHLPVKEFSKGYFVVMATKNGVIKKTDLMAYSNPRVSGIIALTLDKGDRLVSSRLTDGKNDIFLTTRSGLCIRFNEKKARPMGRAARGVKAISLKKGDEVISMDSVIKGTSILTVTENGFGKRTNIDDYRITNRGGKGIITIKITEKNGPVIGSLQVSEDDEIMLITNKGKIVRMKSKGISRMSRNTQGVRLLRLEEEEKAVAVTRLAETEDEE